MASSHTTNTAHVTPHAFLNTVDAHPISPGPIRPTLITMPTKHKAFRQMMRNTVNDNIATQLRVYNRSSLVSVDKDTSGLNEEHWA